MLGDYYNDIHEAAKVKAHAKHAMHGEKPTAYFSSLVKARAQKSLIIEIYPSNNSAIITNIDDILHEATNFYSTLYQAKNTNKGVKRSLFLEALDVTFSDSDKASCYQKVDKDEVLSSLRKLSSGKAPGVDGLPVGYFKPFWPSIGDAYMDLLLECLESKELPLTMQTSVITLIYKKEDRDKSKHYRPILLLCADYKVIAKVMAKRIKKFMHKLVLDDQTGFDPGRNINQNIIVTFLEVQDYICIKLKSRILRLAFLADVEKAFDSVCGDSLIEASLRKLNFGDYFISWFLTLHKKSTAKLIINGFLSNSFDISSGLRQGCPWAPLLFLAATEPLACNIRLSQIGLSLPHGLSSYKGYADNTCCYLANLLHIRKLLQMFNDYKEVSGQN
jgi:hypothetical protein